MRGEDKLQADMFSYLSPESRVRTDHPLRAIRAMADQALDEMSPLFDALYATTGRPSIPPEKLLRAQLIQMLYWVRSERLLMEEIDYSVLFSVVCGNEHGRRSLGRDRVHQEPRPAVGWRCGAGVLVAGSEPSAGARTDFGRAFYGGRHAGGSVGGSEEFSAKGSGQAGPAAR